MEKEAAQTERNLKATIISATYHCLRTGGQQNKTRQEANERLKNDTDGDWRLIHNAKIGLPRRSNESPLG